MSKRSPKSVSEKLELVLLHSEEGKSISWLARLKKHYQTGFGNTKKLVLKG